MKREKRKEPRHLEPPPMATTRKQSVEILRVWAEPSGNQQVALRTLWDDPGAWGILLVDVVRHLGNAYANQGREAGEVIKRVRELFDAEWASPTGEAEEVTE